MRLVIFDVDGTLTQTMETDAECFVGSLAEVCGFTVSGLQLPSKGTADHVTTNSRLSIDGYPLTTRNDAR